jgi:hypothetical protein
MNLPGARGLFGLVVLCGGCAAPDVQVGTTHAPVVFGELSPAGGIEDAVLMVRTTVDGVEVLCSASLVAPRLVLTARHCVARLEDGPFNCTPRGELVDNPTGAGRLGLDLPAESLELYGGSTPRKEPIANGQRVISTLSDTICLDDIAFVVLDRPVPLPALSMRLETTTSVGEPAVLVGYGLDEKQSQTIDYRTQPRRRKAELSIADVGPDSIDDGVTTAAPRTLWLKGPSGCSADSGGPLLSEKTNAIVGVYSLLDGATCTDSDVRNEFVHVRPFKGLIEEAFTAAEAEPLAEQSTAPVPEPSEASPETGTAPFVQSSNHASTGCGIAGSSLGAFPASTGAWLCGLAVVACAARRRTGGARGTRRVSAGLRADRPAPDLAPPSRLSRSHAGPAWRRRREARWLGRSSVVEPSAQLSRKE